MDKKAINGIPLTYLGKPSPAYGLEIFRDHFSWFLDLKADAVDGSYDLFPFVGLHLLVAPCFDSLDYPSNQETADEMWAHCLAPQRLRVGAPGERTLEMRYKINLYSPQFVARQFGFAQALPSPVSFNQSNQLIQYEIGNADEFAHALELNEERIERYR